jgi:hypothetical protein
METSSRPSDAQSRGVGSLFDDTERKQILKKYVLFLGWIEILIFVVCWLYQLGTEGYNRYGPVEIAFPWKTYFLISFVVPVAITFLLGIVIVGFNRYLAEQDEGAAAAAAVEGDGDGANADHGRRIYRIKSYLSLFRRLPFLISLLLLGLGAGIVYKIDVILRVMGAVGEQTARVLLIAGAVLLGVGSFFGLVMVVLNYKLRKKSMEYQYRSELAERFGLIVLDDNTVLNHEGKLLVAGRKGKSSVPMLPRESSLPDQKKDQPEKPEQADSDGEAQGARPSHGSS